MSNAMIILTTSIMTFVLLAVLLPFAQESLSSDTINDNNFEDFIVDILTAEFSLLSIPIWIIALISSVFAYTFGAGLWLNLLLLIPIRIIMGISFYYVIAPTK